MNLDALTTLRNYWETLRDGRIAPYRAELDPRKFEDALENMFILEQLNPSQLRVRLAGMRLCELMGMEVRGMPPEALMAADARDLFTQLLSSVLAIPAVAELDLQAHDSKGRSVDAHMLLLPLRSDFGEITRILGCIAAPESLQNAPINFSITGQRTFQIKAREEVEAAGLPGFGEHQTPFQPANTQPALRSIDGDAAATGTARRLSRDHLKLIKND